MDGNSLISGVPHQTTSQNTTDVAAPIDADAYDADLAQQELLIVVETAAVRFAFGGTVPTQAGLGVKVDPGGAIRISGLQAIKGTKVISSGAGTPGTLQIVQMVV